MIKKENNPSLSSNSTMSLFVGEPTIELSIIISLSCTSNVLTLNVHSDLEWEILSGIANKSTRNLIARNSSSGGKIDEKI